MTRLTPNQKAKLEALWRSMPVHMRSALVASAQASGGHDEASSRLISVFKELQESVQEPAGDLAKAYLLAPLKPLIGDRENVQPSRARFSPDQVSKLWGWLGRHLAKQTIETAKKCKKPPTDEIWYEFRSQLGEALDEGIKKAERVPKDMTALAKRFGGGDSGDMLRDAVVLLRNAKPIDECMNRLPARIYDLDEDLVHRVSKMHEQLVEEAPDGAVWMLLLTMGRLEQPWEIFRVVERIGKRGDDLVVSKTELAAVGDAVLADTGFFATKLKSPPANLEEAKKTYERYDRFVSYSTGMTQEFGIRKAGRWGQALFSLRAEASTNTEKVFEKVPLALDSGLPEPRRGKSGRIIPAQLPPEASVDRAEGLIYFLARAREHAKAAAVASSQKRLADASVKRLQEAGELLVDLVANSEGQNRNVAQEGLLITARLLEAADAGEDAATLRRRGNSAAAA